jgi:hypothetical protein
VTLAAARARELVRDHEHLVPLIVVPLICEGGMRPTDARAMARRIVLVAAAREVFKLQRGEIEQGLGISTRMQQRDARAWQDVLDDRQARATQPMFCGGLTAVPA